MQKPKQSGRAARAGQQPDPALPEGAGESDAHPDRPESDDVLDIYRVVCPDCAQSIALVTHEDLLPEHALCPSPWNPFGLKVCRGTGRPVADAPAAEALGLDLDAEAALLLTLPQGLDWRYQPFSHVGGPRSRPMQVPRAYRRAA